MTGNILMTIIVNTAVFSALFCIALLLRKTIGKKISPVLMLALWALVILKLVIPFGFESGLSVLPPGAETSAAMIETPQAPPDSAAEKYLDGAAANTDATVSVPQGDNSRAGAQAYESPAKQTSGVDWKLAALGVWGAGVILTGTMLLLSAMRLKKRIMHSQEDTPEYAVRLFEECRQSLGIRRDIGIITQTALNTPVIMGALKPVLALPEQAVRDEQTLRHIFLHELTHYKWGDLWAINIMNVLRTLYWFNPLVWICFKLVRADMEIACDQKVINVLGQVHRLSYIDTLLGFAEQKQLAAAALGLFDGRCGMEHRIRGIFGKAKTGVKGRIAAGLMAVFMLAACVLTACQPVNLATVTLAAYERIGRWEETINDEKLTIEINADIMQPAVSEYPVIKVEPLIFSQQRVDELVDYFTRGRKLYKPHGRTKADYAEEIAGLNEGYWLGGRKVVTADTKVGISRLEREMADAPESYPKEYISSALTYAIDDETLAEVKESGKNYLYAMVENADGNDARIGISNSSKEYRYLTSFYYVAPQSHAYQSESYINYWLRYIETEPYAAAASDMRKNMRIDELTALLGSVTLKQEDARKAADKAISDLGIEDLTLTGAGRAVSLEYTDKGGWKFEYVRQNGGIPADTAVVTTDDPMQSMYCYPERLSVLVTEDGIQEFDWFCCADVNEEVFENAQLLPFEEIKKAAIESIRNKTSGKLGYKVYKSSGREIKGYGMEDYKLKLKSARLTDAYTYTDDYPAGALLVPVWVFETELCYYDPVREITFTEDETYMLSATDGAALEGEVIWY